MTERTHTTAASMAAAALLAALALPATPALAQEDGRWLPWVGCWENVDAENPDEGLLCVRPVADGVEMLSVVDGEIVATETLSADGRAQPIEREGCTGYQSARFSADHRRLFTTSEHTCGGEFTRSATGLIAMTSPSTWVDVQVVDAGGRDMAWVRHYRLAPASRVEEAGFAGLGAGLGMALRTARYDAASAVDVDDVVEATRHVHAEAVRAWVAETREPFALDADRLVELADAGVDPEIIDVMVAVSFPEHFAVDDDRSRPDRYEDYGAYGRRGWYDPWGRYGYRGGFYYDPFYSPYSGYGYGGYYRYRPRVVVVTPVDDDGGRGRIVNGRGYTRGSRGSGTSGGSPPSVGRSGSSGSGSVSSGSSGSSGSSTGRKAKRRGGGGGGDGGGGGLF